MSSSETTEAHLPLAAGELAAHTRAMATDVSIRVPGGEGNAAVAEALTAALEVFARVERACTRFDPESPLMKANASPRGWHRLPVECYAAVGAAHAAYQRTHGVFDPRILKDLVGLGYDRSLPFSGPAPVSVEARPAARRPVLGPWRPRFRGATREVRLGDHPIDLGGIGKGLAIRWASEVLTGAARHHLVEVGGDCWCAGHSAEGTPWRIAVEDPHGDPTPVAVLEVSDRAVATSSTRVRRWTAGGRSVHHLLDARTGRPGGCGLASVTVVGHDPALAEVWSKTLFLAGEAGIAALAALRGLAALWVSEAGDLHASQAAARYLLWQR